MALSLECGCTNTGYTKITLKNWSVGKNLGVYRATAYTSIDALGNSGATVVSPSSSAQSGSSTFDVWQASSSNANRTAFTNIYTAKSAGADSHSYDNCVRMPTAPPAPSVSTWFTSGTTAYFNIDYSVGYGSVSLAILGCYGDNYLTSSYKVVTSGVTSSGSDYFYASRGASGSGYVYGCGGASQGSSLGGGWWYSYEKGSYASHDNSMVQGSYISQYVDANITKYLYYNANGGTGAPSTQSYTDTSSTHTFTVSYVEPTREGFTFLGWSTSSTATSPSYYGGSSITTSGTTLYAVWRDNRNSITVSAGTNVTVSPSTSTQYVATGGSITYTLSTPLNYGAVISVTDSPSSGGTLSSWISEWSTNGTKNILTVVFKFENMSGSKTTVTVSSQAKKYKTNFTYYDKNGQQLGDSFDVESGNTFVFRAAEQVEGYIWKGWRIGGTVYQAGSTYTNTVVATNSPDVLTYGEIYPVYEKKLDWYKSFEGVFTPASGLFKSLTNWGSPNRLFHKSTSYKQVGGAYLIEHVPPAPPVSVEGVEIYYTVSPSSWRTEQSYTLTAEIDPEDATNQNVVWAVGDTSIVSLTSQTGLSATFEVLAAGNTTISVTTEDGGFTDGITVKATAPVDVSGLMTADPDTAYLPDGVDAVLENCTDPDVLAWAEQYKADNKYYKYVNDGLPMTWTINGENIYDLFDENGYVVADVIKGESLATQTSTSWIVKCVPYGGSTYTLFAKGATTSAKSMATEPTPDDDVRNPKGFLLYLDLQVSPQV